MKRSVFFLSLVLFAHSLPATPVPPSVFDTVLNRVYASLRESAPPQLEKIVERELTSIHGDGSWSDIDYDNTSITQWTPEPHLKRIEEMALAYAQRAAVPGGYPTLYPAIVAGLRYWHRKDPKSGNWWNNEIRVPQMLGQILIILRFAPARIPTTLEDSLIIRMRRGDVLKQTGANKLDVAIHILYRAALTRDPHLMDTAVQQAFQPLEFTTEEGLQPDYSYLQHGPQLQLSSYGAVFLSGEYKVAKYVRGTPYALTDTPLRRLSTYYENSYLRAIRGSYSDFNVEGRGISRPGVLNKTNERSLLSQAQLVDPANGGDWYLAMARTSGTQPPGYQVTPGHTHFWRGDYSMHIRPSYSFNVRMVSARTRRTEAGNKENLYGRYLPDGSTNIQVTGNEYYNIMPVWEWDKIPGVTAADHIEDKPMDKFWGEPGSTAFAGGVSDSLYGASAYEMNYDGVTAKKSWFFFDHEIVCLGAGISSASDENICTTINQCWLEGEVKLTKTITLPKNKSKEFTAPLYVWHNGTGYFFPDSGSITVNTLSQKGNWYHINNGYSKEQVSGNVFKLWLNHGPKPAAAKYAYIVLPGVDSDKGAAAATGVRIIVNSDSLQAVKHPGLDMLQAVFYKAGTLTDSGLTLHADHPCIVMLKHLSAEPVTVSVADPSQEAESITLTLTDPALKEPRQLVCRLPQGAFAGATVSAVFPSFINENFSFARRQLTGLLAAAKKSDTLFPRSTDSTGKMVATGMHDWTGGFFPGSLWYTYEYTKDPRLKAAAQEWTERLAPMQFFTGHHDLGFVLYTSFGNGYRLTGNKAYADVLVQAAKSLATRFDPRVGAIKSWNSFTSWHGGTPYSYPVIIDNMMNLELLFFASKITGDPRYREIAIRHAETTMKNQVRSDYSCYHVVCYDSATGAVVTRETAQGYADNSAWSRGQAWGIYGFTVAYRETKAPEFLTTARRMADFYLHHKNLPPDGVPYWDFDVNQPGYVPGIRSGAKAGTAPMLRDASAAAIAASALFQLSVALGKTGGAYYFTSAEKILHSLAAPAYRAAPGENAHFLLKHSVGSIPHGFEIDTPLIYADYYFLEALQYYKRFSIAK